jgi:hypothetical protein
MKMPANVVDQLVIGVNSDIRQVLNMLSTWKLSSDTMDFDEGRALCVVLPLVRPPARLLIVCARRAKMNEKYAVMSPFNITHEILGPTMWERSSRRTLGDKMELYFHDYSFVPLFMQARLFFLPYILFGGFVFRLQCVVLLRWSSPCFYPRHLSIFASLSLSFVIIAQLTPHDRKTTSRRHLRGRAPSTGRSAR